MHFPRLFGSSSQSGSQSASAAVEPPSLRDFATITLAPPAPPQQQQTRTHHELPRLQVPPLSLIQPQQPQQPQLHWKAHVTSVEQPPPPPPVSRMRMVANFFTSEGRQQQLQQQLQQQQQVAPVQSSNMLPSFSEILARTKQLYINPSPSNGAVNEVMMDTMEDAEPQPLERPTVEPPMYAAARYTLQAPAAIEVNHGYEDGDAVMDVPSSPSGSMSPTSQSGKSSKRRERWTEDEHARFMEGLNRYGRKWKKIQAFVKTKTAVQVRTHAYGYFAKLLRNMPEDDAAWELAEEMSSLPGAVLKGPSNGKRRSEPKTDEAGMDVLRRFVFSKKKSEAPLKGEMASTAHQIGGDSLLDDGDRSSVEFPQQMWGSQENWNVMESQASSVMLDLKRQRIK